MFHTNRFIFHVDLNAFYASVECLYQPHLRRLPVIVTGDPSLRNGIVLTKNQIAKGYGIQTGEPIWQARKKCPNVVPVLADFPLYMRYSASLRDILHDYSDREEPFGLDECWVDVTQPGMTFQSATRMADCLRYRIFKELGITASIGVSNNKAFAKLGSDMKKPNATTTISPENYQQKVWPLPDTCHELLRMASQGWQGDEGKVCHQGAGRRHDTHGRPLSARRRRGVPGLYDHHAGASARYCVRPQPHAHDTGQGSGPRMDARRRIG